MTLRKDEETPLHEVKDMTTDKEAIDIKEGGEEIRIVEIQLGYAILPCFKVVVIDEEVMFICSNFLQWIFKVFFARLWKGKVHITKERRQI